MPRIAATAALAGLLAALAGCASIPAEEKALLTADIDCARAPQQIAALDAAKPGAGRTLRAVGTTLTPLGMAVGIATNDLRDRDRIASGQYAEELEARIAQIRKACGLPDPAPSSPPGA